MKLKRTLVVFDFDGTLFKSPYKPDSWKGAWWSNIKSLIPPLVPQEPDSSWWNEPICEKAFEYLNDPECYTILLTGRIERVFKERVEEILQQKGFNFPYVGLAQLNTSIDSKFKHLNNVLADNPFIDKIIFYDDRVEHFSSFKDFCKDKGVECMINHVQEAYTLLEGKDNRKNVYVLIGPPGVGKSTFIKNNPGLSKAIIVSRDNIVERVAEESGYTYNEMFGEDPEIKQLNSKINQELASNIDSASDSNENVVIDMTNLNVKGRKGIINKFPSNKFRRIAVDFMIKPNNFDKLLKQNQKREEEYKKAGKTKKIISNVLKMMMDRYEAPTEEEGFDRITKVDVDSRLNNIDQ